MTERKVTFQDKTNKTAIIDRSKQVAAEDLNELKTIANLHADDINVQAVQIIRLHNPKLIPKGFAYVSDSTPASSEGEAWVCGESGQIFGKDVTKGQVIRYSGTSFIVENVVNLIEKFADKIVGGKNLFNPNAEDVLYDRYVNNVTGGIGISSSFNVTGFIPVSALTFYSMSYIRMLVWYDIDKYYISGVDSNIDDNKTQQSPVNAAYLRCTVLKSEWNTFQIEEGESRTAYEAYFEVLKSTKIATPNIKSFAITNDKLAGQSVTENKIALEFKEKIYSVGKNKFDKTAITAGKYVNWELGGLSTNSSYDASDYMEVKPETSYFCADIIHFAFYDENKTFISGESNNADIVVSPTGAYFCRISINAGTGDNVQFEEGVEATQYEEYFKGTVIADNQIQERHLSDALKATLNISGEIDIVMPDKYIVVVGSSIQLFYHGFIKTTNPYKYNIIVDCDKGNAYSRYWQFTPVLSDIGIYTFSIILKDDRGNLVAFKSTSIQVVEKVQNPSTLKNIITVGDSLNNSLTDWGGAMATQVVNGTNLLPGLAAFSNIEFIGEYGTAPKQYTGQGGWNWANYNNEPDPSTADVWVYAIHDKDASDQESIWEDSATNQWQLETIESNRLKFKRYGGHTANMPAAPDLLTYVANATHTATINYTAIQIADSNPFWNEGTSEVDFVNWFQNKYPTKHSGGQLIDACFVLLGWNGGHYGKPEESDWDDYIVTAKTFLDNLHADYPSCKVYVMGCQYPSLNGGLGDDYGAKANYYSDIFDVIQSVQSLNKAYQTLCNNPTYSSFCQFINISGQFDSENNMPSADVAVNIRSAITEKRGTNGVHPSNEGYLQIADAAIRYLVKDFCQ